MLAESYRHLMDLSPSHHLEDKRMYEHLAKT